MKHKYNAYWYVGGVCYRAVSISGLWRLCIETKPDRWEFVNDLEYRNASEAFADIA